MTLLGHALISTEDPKDFAEAEPLLKAAIARDRDNPFAWYQLGTIYDRKGDEPRAALAAAERYSLQGNAKGAAMNARLAMNGLPRGSPDWIRADDIALVAGDALATQEEAPLMAGTFPQRMKTMMETRVRAVWLVAAVVVAGLGGAVLAAGTASAPVAPGDRAAIEKIVHDYIMAHPEIIPEAMARMQSREVEKLLASNRKEIQTPFASAMAGNPNGDVTLVVFFDFACPYCRQGQADVAKLVAGDPQLKVVFRDFPVLSPASDEAAMAALSAAQQGKYLKFHDAMFTTPGKVTHERTVAVVRSAGLDEMKTAKDLNSPALKAEIEEEPRSWPGAGADRHAELCRRQPDPVGRCRL